jgi:hypothetical protein
MPKFFTGAIASQLVLREGKLVVCKWRDALCESYDLIQVFTQTLLTYNEPVLLVSLLKADCPATL